MGSKELKDNNKDSIVAQMVIKVPSLSGSEDLLGEAYDVFNAAVTIDKDGNSQVDAEVLELFFEELNEEEESLLSKRFEVEDFRSPLHGKTPLSYIREQVAVAKR